MTSASLTLSAARQPFNAIRFAIVSALRSARRSWALARARERRAALELATWEQLRDLDERMLDDIGLKPGDLPWMADATRSRGSRTTPRHGGTLSA